MMKCLAFSAFAVLCLTVPAHAQFQGWSPKSSFVAGPVQTVKREGALPLSDIKASLQRRFGGDMLDARLEGGNYIILWQTGDGRRIQLEVDSQTGEVIREIRTR